MEKNNNQKKGILDVICGPMFAGKSEELIRRLRHAKKEKKHIIAFKHSLENRYDISTITSHNGTQLKAMATSDSKEILTTALHKEPSVIGIDEVQFFDNEIITTICQLLDNDHHVIAAGLDLDFRGIPFGSMPILLALSRSITKLQAHCSLCHADAFYTQRLVNNQPARYHDPIIMVGAEEAYQARCQSCYIIDIKPSQHYHENSI